MAASQTVGKLGFTTPKLFRSGAVAGARARPVGIYGKPGAILDTRIMRGRQGARFDTVWRIADAAAR